MQHGLIGVGARGRRKRRDTRAIERSGILGQGTLLSIVVGGGYADRLQVCLRNAEVECIAGRAVESGVFGGLLLLGTAIGGLALDRGLGDGHGAGILIVGEGRGRGSQHVRVDMVAETVQVVEERVDLVLQGLDMRVHALELSADSQSVSQSVDAILAKAE